MVVAATRRQVEAVDAYVQLQREQPGLFRHRSRRRLVLAREELLEFAAQHDEVLGVLAATPYLWLLNDLVDTPQPDGSVLRHPYLREIDPPGAETAHGVVVLATLSATDTHACRVVMVEQERHATGNVELELPRGFGEPGRDSQAQAVRELLEETGFLAGDVTFLGSSLTDSGISDGLVDFFHIAATSRRSAQPEPSEGAIAVTLLALEDLWAAAASGRLRDGYTLQALALLTASGRELP